MKPKVLLFLCNGFEALEAAVFTDVFGWSREHGIAPVELVTAGFSKHVKCTWNFTVHSELLYEEINPDDFDALAIPGGFESAGFYIEAFDERFLSIIKTFAEAGKPIASVCVGVLPVAKAGVLIGKKASVYDLPDGNRPEQLKSFGAELSSTPITVDAEFISCSGPAYAIDVAFSLLEKLTSKENADQVKLYMRFNN